MITADSQIFKNSKIPWRIIEGEGVLVDVAKGEVIHLNPVGASIWELIDGQRTIGQIIAAIGDEYEIDSRTASDDVLSFTAQLMEKGVVGCPAGQEN